LLYVRSPWACLERVYAKKKGGKISRLGTFNYEVHE